MKKHIFLPIILLLSSSISLIQSLECSNPNLSRSIKTNNKISQDNDQIIKRLVYLQPEDVVQNLKTDDAEPLGSIANKDTSESDAQNQVKQETGAWFSHMSESTDPSRFIKIKADRDVAMNEIDFWARQMSEHILFVFLGLEDPELKREALELHQTLEKFREKFVENPNDINHMNSLLPILKKEREYQIKAAKILKDGKWIGWLYPLFLDHITMELDYFVDKLNGVKYTPQEELNYWNRVNGEHASFSVRLLDPYEKKSISKADRIAQEFQDIPQTELDMMIKLSLKASKELDEFHKATRSNFKNIRSTIHPVLLGHVIREGERSIKTIKNLGLYKEAAEFQKRHDKQIEEYSTKPLIDETAVKTSSSIIDSTIDNTIDNIDAIIAEQQPPTE